MSFRGKWIFGACLLAAWLSGGEVRADWKDAVTSWTSGEFRELDKRLAQVERDLVELPKLMERPFAWRYGFRSSTSTEPMRPMWVQIDLKQSRLVDRIVAVPVHIPQLGAVGVGYGFPKRFRIEISDDPEMMDAVTVVDETGAAFPNPGRYPVTFAITPVRGRYVRFTSVEHCRIEEGFFWALEELIILEGNRSVGSARPVDSNGAVEMFPNWSKSRIQDGQSALGLPVSVDPSPHYGYLSDLTVDPNEPKWLQVDLGQTYPVDEIRLFPVQAEGYESLGEKSFPRGWKLELSEHEDFREVAWSFRMGPTNLVGYPGDCAIHLQGDGTPARYIRLTTLRLWGDMDRHGYGLAELQAYSGDRNVALNRTVWVSDENSQSPGWSPEYVTDGFGSKNRLIEIPEYLALIERRRVLESERAGISASMKAKSAATGRVIVYGSVGVGGMAILGCGWLLARQQRVRRKDLIQLREQIARDLHDDIGSNLGGIALLGEIGCEHSSDPQARQDFRTIREAAEEASQSMRDIVWLVAGDRSTVRDLIAKMRQSAQLILGDRDVRVSVDPQDFKERSMSLLFRRHVLLSFKEALNNARKHSGSDRVDISIRMDTSHLTFCVKDFGVGFSPELSEQSGHGLANMRRRAQRLGGKVRFESAEGEGSEVTFSAPLRA